MFAWLLVAAAVVVLAVDCPSGVGCTTGVCTCPFYKPCDELGYGGVGECAYSDAQYFGTGAAALVLGMVLVGSGCCCAQRRREPQFVIVNTKPDDGVPKIVMHQMTD
jgi:hypothetical protein